MVKPMNHNKSRQCRFCQQDDDDNHNKLFRPCACRGPIHPDCLRTLRFAPSLDAHVRQRCTLCHTAYTVQKGPAARTWLHWGTICMDVGRTTTIWVALATLFVLVLTQIHLMDAVINPWSIVLGMYLFAYLTWVIFFYNKASVYGVFGGIAAGGYGLYQRDNLLSYVGAGESLKWWLDIVCVLVCLVHHFRDSMLTYDGFDDIVVARGTNKAERQRADL